MSDSRRFDVRNELGKGAFGAVYLADFTSVSGFTKLVALKVLHAEWSQNPEMVVRLAEEARLLGRLRHPNIVAVDDLVQIEGQWAVVMEYIPGVDVEAIVHRAREDERPVPLAVVVGIAEAVARALDAAWSSVGRDGVPLHVVHRDIKPSNIRVTPDGAVKVLDFGIAASPERDAARAGSPAYMSPERLGGMADGPEGDVYAVGATLYELLVGDMLGCSVGGRDAHEARVAGAHAQVLAVRGPAASSIADLLARVLAYAPEARLSARELADAARTLSRTTLDGDLVAWARGFVDDSGAATPRSNLTLIGNVGAAQTLLFADFGDEVGTPQAKDTAAGTVPDLDVLPASPVVVPSVVPAVAPARWKSVAVVVVVVASLFGVYGFWAPAEPPVRAVSPPLPVAVVVAPAGPSNPSPAPSEAPNAVADSGPPVVPALPQVSAAAAQARAGEARAAPVRSAPPAAEVAVGTPLPTKSAAAGGLASDPARLRAAKFSVPGASHVMARCGDVTEEGPSSANLRGILPGVCEVVATVNGGTHRGTVRIDAPRLVLCTVVDGGLSCS